MLYQRGSAGHSAESCAYCQTRKINLHIQGQVLLQVNAIYRLGGREKEAVGKYSLQVLRSFRFLQVSRTDWGIRSCGTYVLVHTSTQEK